MYFLYGVLRIADFLSVFGAAILAHTLYLSGEDTIWEHYYLAGVAGALSAAVIFHLQGIYVYKSQLVPFGRLRIANLGVAWAATILFLITLAFTLQISALYSRAWVVLWFSLALLFMTVERVARWSIERAWLRSGKLTRRIIIYGGGENAAKLIQKLRSSQDHSFTIAGYFDDRPRSGNRQHPAMTAENYLGTIEDMIAYGRTHRVDQIIVAIPWSAEQRLLKICKTLRSLPVDVQLAPDFSGFHLLNSTITYMGGVTLFAVFSKPMNDWNYVIKTIEDRVLGTLLIIFVSPLLAVIALAIRRDSPGPIFFRQKRYGFNNQLIEVFKFRTMYVDQTDHNGDVLTTKNDARVTRVGRFLRKTSFDELPQLINVLKGEMSIVGPRPHATGAKAADRLYEDVVDGYAARHRVKPGITGWAQVNGFRGETDTEEKIVKRVEHDLFYIENWTPMLDVKILCMTPRAVLKPDNAY
jgi:Undecaprenyl-phosphate glucose phosphotransferase